MGALTNPPQNHLEQRVARPEQPMLAISLHYTHFNGRHYLHWYTHKALGIHLNTDTLSALLGRRPNEGHTTTTSICTVARKQLDLSCSKMLIMYACVVHYAWFTIIMTLGDCVVRHY